ncbi:sensor histidine kinase [Alkalihalobacillus deserti]|uniref:sensor histidine kinase n=1 Tax=Alkalihalobacillus deserti TaxID=2879466 RepID=UPI001D133734|nr:sensor histidine kinase [Alkalihalobacillus deserti]
MKLSTKLASLFFLSTVLIIIAMGTSFYFLSKSFYKDQLQKDIEYRLEAHREVIEAHMNPETFWHVVIMEQKERENSFIIYDTEFNVQASNQQISRDMLERYRDWLMEATEFKTRRTDFIETMVHHIPHIWSFEPFMEDEEVAGYLFIDQDTGSFEEARWKLFVIATVMGMITLLFSGILIIFFSKKITLPLTNARNLTKRIAKGDFDVELISKGKDELADLMKDITSMARQLKEYRDSRQQFLTNISHDLRTPLTYIKAYSALLKDKELDPELIKDQSAVIYLEATRMERLVIDLFQLMKLEEGKVTMTMQGIDLVDFIRTVTKKVKSASDKRKIDLLVSSSQSEIVANVNIDLFERALLNLLNNGVRHTKPFGQIKIRITKQLNDIKIEIEDNGEGIPEEALPYIWDRFYRVDKSRSSMSGGSGLGLAITKQIIEHHGGTINISSTVNVGTIFTIMLPRIY